VLGVRELAVEHEPSTNLWWCRESLVRARWLAVARRMPHGRFLLLEPPVTAVPWLSHPEEVGQIVVDFLQGRR
jgi:hypothetical protein